MKNSDRLCGCRFTDIHIVEFGNHYAVAVSAALMFWDQAPVTLHARFRYERNWEDEFGVFAGSAIVQRASRNKYLATLKFYGSILSRVNRGSFVWISTAPEHRVVPDVLFFSLMVVAFRKRIAVSIRDLNNWTTGYSRRPDYLFSIILRKFFIKFVHAVVLETEEQSGIFSEFFPSFRGAVKVVPTMFSDSARVWGLSSAVRHSAYGGETLRIGLLGAVDPSRRNFKQLCDAIDIAQTQLKQQIELVILGNVATKASQESLGMLKGVAEVESHNAFLPQREMIEKARSCAVLSAPLMPYKLYGKERGTGVFGDALVTGIKVLVPDFADPSRRHNSLSIAYADSIDLAERLVEIGKSCKTQRVDHQTLSRYMASTIGEEVRRTFNLEFLIR